MGAMDVRWGTYTMPKATTPLASYKKPSKPSGLFGHITEIAGNLLEDVRDTAVGIPMGLVQLAEHPVRSIKAMGHAEWATYSPLFHGKVGEFLHGLEEHPLQPILDIATIVTLGGAAAGTLSTSAAKGLAAAGNAGRATEVLAGIGGKTISAEGRIVARDPISIISESKRLAGKPIKGTGIPENAPEFFRPVHSNPVIRMRQQAFRSMANKIGDQFGTTVVKGGRVKTTGAARFVGEAARYNKSLGKIEANRSAATSKLYQIWLKEALKIKGMTGEQIWKALSPHFNEQMTRHHMFITPSRLRQTSGGELRLARGYQFRRDPKLPRREYIPKDNSPQELHKAMEKWSKDEFTNDVNEALHVPGKGYAVARSVDAMKQEASNAYRAIHAIHSKPMQVWKWLVLAASPRFFVNNVVGNMMMYVMATNPKASMMGMAHTAQQLVAKKRYINEVSGLDRATRAVAGDTLDQEILGQLGGFAEGELRAAQRGVNSFKGKGRVVHAVKSGLYPITHFISDTLVRRSVANYAVKRTSAYQLEYQQLRANGVSYFAAHNQALAKALTDNNVKGFVHTSIDNVLGDYNYLSKTERAVKNVVPFYTWDRAIMRHTSEMVKNRPYQAVMLAGIGRQGVEETQKALGHVPTFLKGAIPVGSHTDGILGWIFGVGVGGRTRILTTQGLNPYATVPDITAAIGALGGIGKLSAGETVGSQISPFLAGGIEAITGTSLLSGAPIDKAHGGVLGSIGEHVVTSLPQFRLLESAMRGADVGDDPDRPKLFTSDFRQQLSGFLGAPMKDVSKTSMATIYAREHPANRQYRKKTARSLFAPPSKSGLPGF